MAIAPNATGAVLATSVTNTAFIGFMPIASSMAATMATGAPKPARASNKPPNEKPISRACTRISPRPILEKISRRSSKRLDLTVRSYTHTAIQMMNTMGNKPNAMPSVMVRTARLAGMANNTIATMSAMTIAPIADQ